MSSPYRYLDQEQCAWVRAWWQALQPPSLGDVSFVSREFGRAARAKIRRCRTVEELEQELAPNRLAAHFAESTQTQKAWLQRWFKGHYEALFLLAGVLAHVTNDARDGQSLAMRTGNAKAASDRPAQMSELRFKRLLRATDTEDFYRQIRRAVELAKGEADVAVLADDMVAWSYERDTQAREWKPSESLKFRWARDYYLTAKEQLSSESTNSKSDTASEV